jgi:CDP-glucose 4,6-dehydratase
MDNLENLNLFNGIYKNKTILVTGHTGFKGAWLTLWLKALGAKVVGYSLQPPTEPSLFETLELEKHITHIIGDIRDAEKVRTVFEKHKPDIVFHLAAQPLVRVSYDNPRYTFETNVIGTLNVLEAAKKTPSVKVLVNITTDKCYQNKEISYSYQEQDPLGGNDPYSSSKACSEHITHAYRQSFFHPDNHGTKHTLAIATARAGNVLGGGDWAQDRIIPDCVKALSQNKPIQIRNPNAVRPWQFVL